MKTRIYVLGNDPVDGRLGGIEVTDLTEETYKELTSYLSSELRKYYLPEAVMYETPGQRFAFISTRIGPRVTGQLVHQLQSQGDSA